VNFKCRPGIHTLSYIGRKLHSIDEDKDGGLHPL